MIVVCGGNEGCYLFLVGVSMKKLIWDNWYNVSIVVCVFFIMSFSYIFYKIFIRILLIVFYLDYLKCFFLLNILF